MVVAGACVLLVSETSLVHYTKRPAALDSPGIATASAISTAGCIVEPSPPMVDEKYWKRRYNYFARFDEGIRMDAAAWFEVTPESVARHIADRMPYNRVVDGTCGVGGNAIQFAMTSPHVLAVDTDVGRLRDAAHNATIYGVRERIEFVCDDFVVFAANYSGPPIDAVFLSPPWGGPAHLDAPSFSLKDVEYLDIVRLFAAAAAVSPRVALYLPRHVDLHEVAILATMCGFAAVEVEKVLFEYPTPHLKLCVVYFTPEAAIAPPPASSLRRSIGRKKTDIRRPQAACHQAAVAKSAGGGGEGPFHNLPPLELAGPLIRALYCRFHYVGRYAVAVALTLERGGPLPGLPRCVTEHDEKMKKKGRRATLERRIPQVHPCGCGGGDGGAGSTVDSADRDAGLCHRMLRRDVARGIHEATLGGSCGRSYADNDADAREEEDAEILTRLEWLLGVLPLAEVMRLASDADAASASVPLASTEPCGACDASAVAPPQLSRLGSAAAAWGDRVECLLSTRFPEVHRRMLDWRKVAALRVVAG